MTTGLTNTATMNIYRFLISIRLSIVLLILLTVDLGLGYIFLHGNSFIYEPMNEIGIIQWLLTYGLANIYLSAWFFVLLFLLLCLVINTLCCTGDKLYRLFTAKKLNYRKRGVLLTLSIHLMHVAMVLLLVGYFISYTTTTIHNSITLPNGGSFKVPKSDITVELLSMDLVTYPGERNKSFVNRNIDVSAHLKFQDKHSSEKNVISMNNPASFGGYSFFIQRFNPRSKRGMSGAQYIVVDIRKDFGVNFTFTGMAFFVLGYISYLILQGRLRTQGSQT